RIGQERPRPGDLPLEQVAETGRSGAVRAPAPKQSRPGEGDVGRDARPEVGENSERPDVESAEIASARARELRVSPGQLAAAREGPQPGTGKTPVAQHRGAKVEERHRRVEVLAERALVAGELAGVEPSGLQ